MFGVVCGLGAVTVVLGVCGGGGAGGGGGEGVGFICACLPSQSAQLNTNDDRSL